MTMTVNYNGSANRALNHFSQNVVARSKSPAKVASGIKINSAADAPKFNHHMRPTAVSDNKTVTLYHRRLDVSDARQYQEQGAKIADGISVKEEYSSILSLLG